MKSQKANNEMKYDSRLKIRVCILSRREILKRLKELTARLEAWQWKYLTFPWRDSLSEYYDDIQDCHETIKEMKERTNPYERGSLDKVKKDESYFTRADMVCANEMWFKYRIDHAPEKGDYSYDICPLDGQNKWIKRTLNGSR